MTMIMRVLLSIILFGIAGFCIFGFLAADEPMDVNARIAYKAGYAALCVFCVLGIARLLARRSPTNRADGT